MKVSNISAALLNVMLMSIVVSGEVLAEERPSEPAKESLSPEDWKVLEYLTTDDEPARVACGQFSKVYPVTGSKNLGDISIKLEGHKLHLQGFSFASEEECRNFIRGGKEQQINLCELNKGFFQAEFEREVEQKWGGREQWQWDCEAKMDELEAQIMEGKKVNCGSCIPDGHACKPNVIRENCGKGTLVPAATDASGAGVCLAPSAQSPAGTRTILASITCTYRLTIISHGSIIVRCSGC